VALVRLGHVGGSMVWCPRTSLRGWAPTRWPRWKISTMLALARTLDDLVQEHIVHGVVVTVHLDVVVPTRAVFHSP
jgi:hypothetical protein